LVDFGLAVVLRLALLGHRARRLGPLHSPHREQKHGAHLDELLACEARLTGKVGAVATLLGVLDTGSLCGLGGLSLCLSGGGHEGDQRITDGLLVGCSILNTSFVAPGQF
jgi:hypothetical protein